jgi:hypothetical protein
MEVPQRLNAMRNDAMRPLEAHSAHDNRKHFDRLASAIFSWRNEVDPKFVKSFPASTVFMNLPANTYTI